MYKVIMITWWGAVYTVAKHQALDEAIALRNFVLETYPDKYFEDLCITSVEVKAEG